MNKFLEQMEMLVKKSEQAEQVEQAPEKVLTYHVYASAREEAIECLRFYASDLRARARKAPTEHSFDNLMLVAEAISKIADEAENSDG